jgi:hypothetical protein
LASAADGGAMRLKGSATFSAKAETGDSSMIAVGADATAPPPTSFMRFRRSVAADGGRNISQ